ncbi:MAG: helix-turn-helix transcriptional regulator [Bacillota bacterium]
MSLFNERLKELKETSGKTQATIAADLQITSQAFSYYINGREPNYDLLIKIADYFGTTTDYLLGRSNMPTFDMEYIHEATGLGHQAIAALVQLKKDLEGWNEETESNYKALLKQAIETIADAGVNIMTPDAMDAFEEICDENEDLLPSALRDQLRVLENAAINFAYAYTTLRVLNRIIRNVDEDPYAVKFIKDVYDVVFSNYKDVDRMLYRQLGSKERIDIRFEEYSASRRAIHERRLLGHLYKLSENTRQRATSPKHDKVFDELCKWARGISVDIGLLHGPNNTTE